MVLKAGGGGGGGREPQPYLNKNRQGTQLEETTIGRTTYGTTLDDAIATGSRLCCTAATIQDVTQVITETRSQVAAWFCFKRTTGAPTISKVLQFFEPDSLKCTGFSSMPKMESARSCPAKCSPSLRILKLLTHMARSLADMVALLHL